MKKDQNQLTWLMVSLIAFNMVWGLGNVVNNYSQQGISVIVSWILILAIYFIPYALIVGQLGSTFKESGGGVSDWVENLYQAAGLFCGLDLLGGAHSLSGSKAAGSFDSAGLGYSGKWRLFEQS